MKRSAKQLKPQMNLPLLNAPATKVPNHKQKELDAYAHGATNQRGPRKQHRATSQRRKR